MRSLRWKIVLVCLALVFIPVFVLKRYAVSFFDRFTRADLEANLRHYAWLAGEQYREGVLEAAPAAAPAAADRFAAFLQREGAELGARLQVLDTNGVVRVDSDAAGAVGASLRDRPEVAAALAGAYSAKARLTPDQRFMYYYIARPIKTPDRQTTLGVVYVVRHTHPIIRAVQEIIGYHKAATALALLLTAAVAAVLAHTLTRRLRRLTRAARAFAAGDARFDEHIGGRDEIGELGQAVRQMAAEIEHRHRFNRDFVQTTAHELRSPLTAIKGAAKLLEGHAGEDPAARREFVAMIRAQTDRMIGLCGQLRDLTGLDVEIPRGQKEEVDYAAWVRDVVARNRLAFEEPHAALELRVPERSLPVFISPARIEQVFVNLLSNAFRYTPADGRVTIEVRPGDDGATVLTDVSDTGCGIAAGDRGQVFDRFFSTVPKDRVREYGSGLGLAIARAIVENHRGRIGVQSPWPAPAAAGAGAADAPRAGGTCVSFSLPLDRRHK